MNKKNIYARLSDPSVKLLKYFLNFVEFSQKKKRNCLKEWRLNKIDIILATKPEKKR